jgi:hypothetical protein
MFAIVDACYMATAFNVDSYGLAAGGGGSFTQQQQAVLDNILGMPYLITAEDRDAFVTTTVYVMYYCVRFEVSLKH